MSGPRPIWKGALKISLVVIPVKVYLATDESETIAFHQLHQVCSSRVRHKRWCPACDLEVPVAELVKGYEFEKSKYVTLSDAELEAVRPESTRVIDLTHFADASALSPVSIQRSYYLAPDGTQAASDLRVVRVAMKNQVGVGKLAIYGREYLVAVRPALVPTATSHNARPVLMLHTLHHAAEIRSADGIEDEGPPNTQAARGDVTLCQQVLATLHGPLNLDDFQDDYRAGVQRVIDAKVKGQEIVTSAPVTTRPVQDFLTALHASLKVPPVTKAKKRRVA